MERAQDTCRVWWTEPGHAKPPARSRRERRALERARCRDLMDEARPSARQPVSRTHSHGCAGLAVGPPGSLVGIDLERETDRDCASLSDLAYSPEECAWLRGLDAAVRRRRFHELWTLKEAFAKALGLDLATALTQCRFIAEAGEFLASIPTDLNWTATVCAPFPGYRLAVVAVGTEPGNNLELSFVGTPGQAAPGAMEFVRVTRPG